MEIQIGMPNKKAVDNFMKWFRKEGFEAFMKSKYNKLDEKNPQSCITCFATDEKLTVGFGSEYAGQYLDLQ